MEQQQEQKHELVVASCELWVGCSWAERCQLICEPQSCLSFASIFFYLLLLESHKIMLQAPKASLNFLSLSFFCSLVIIAPWRKRAISERAQSDCYSNLQFQRLYLARSLLLMLLLLLLLCPGAAFNHPLERRWGRRHPYSFCFCLSARLLAEIAQLCALIRLLLLSRSLCLSLNALNNQSISALLGVI